MFIRMMTLGRFNSMVSVNVDKIEEINIFLSEKSENGCIFNMSCSIGENRYNYKDKVAFKMKEDSILKTINEDMWDEYVATMFGLMIEEARINPLLLVNPADSLYKYIENREIGNKVIASLSSEIKFAVL